MNIPTFFKTYRATLVLSSFIIVVSGLVLILGDLWITNADLTNQMIVLKQRTAIAEARSNGLISASPATPEPADEVTAKEVAASTIPAPNDTDHYDGPKNAPVALIEYSDLECPFCKKHTTTVNALRKEYGDKLVHIFRHYPLPKHLNALMEAQAAECVAKFNGDDAFYKYTNTVFNRSKSTGTTFSQEDMVAIAKELGNDSDAVNSCVTNGDLKAHVESNATDAKAGGVRGTPGTYIRKANGSMTYIVGAVDIASFRTVIDEYLR